MAASKSVTVNWRGN